LGIGDWGLGIGPNPQSPIPNPQSPIPNPQKLKFKIQKIFKYKNLKLKINIKQNTIIEIIHFL
jgi:hypothetical protein